MLLSKGKSQKQFLTDNQIEKLAVAMDSRVKRTWVSCRDVYIQAGLNHYKHKVLFQYIILFNVETKMERNVYYIREKKL